MTRLSTARQKRRTTTNKTLTDMDLQEINNIDITPTDWVEKDSRLKVIGVGGGGCNAVDYMYKQHIEGCTFVVCNTDSQALDNCSVPYKIQLGDGQGAGCNPTDGRNAALDAQDIIKERVMTENTKMLFITAGMGGGTGTGAAPVIASIAKESNILTVGVITLPFDNDNADIMTRAIDGVNELKKNVDSLIIINNQNIYKAFGDMPMQNALSKCDEVLATAVRSIVDIIKEHGLMNLDLRDIDNMMRGSGMAMMGQGEGTGENRLEDAVEAATSSPLLNNCKLHTAQNILVNIVVGTEQGITAGDMEKINQLIKQKTNNADIFKTGLKIVDNPEFGDKVKITLIAVGLEDDVISIAAGQDNVITIEPDFTYDPKHPKVGDEVSFSKPVNENIGFNNRSTVKYKIFENGEVPVMIKKVNEDLNEINNIPAIKRKSIK